MKKYLKKKKKKKQEISFQRQKIEFRNFIKLNMTIK